MEDREMVEKIRSGHESKADEKSKMEGKRTKRLR